MHIQLEDAQGSSLCLPTTTRMQADILCIEPLLHLETCPEGETNPGRSVPTDYQNSSETTFWATEACPN